MRTILLILITGLPFSISAQMGLYDNIEIISHRNIKSITQHVENSINDSVWSGPTYIRFYDTLGRVTKTQSISRRDTTISSTRPFPFGRYRSYNDKNNIDTSGKYYYYENGNLTTTIWCCENDTAHYHQKSKTTYKDGKLIKIEVFNPFSPRKNHTCYYFYNGNEKAYRMNKVLTDSTGFEIVKEYTLYFYNDLNKPIKTYSYEDSILQDSSVYNYIDNTSYEYLHYHIKSERWHKISYKLDSIGKYLESNSFHASELTAKSEYLYDDSGLLNEVIISLPLEGKTHIKTFDYDYYK